MQEANEKPTKIGKFLHLAQPAFKETIDENEFNKYYK